MDGASPNQRQKRLGSYPEAFYFPPYLADMVPPVLAMIMWTSGMAWALLGMP